MSVRSRLFGIAYRMLGSAAEAEDVVQDVWVRWQTADRSAVRDAPAFLATTTTRLAINVIQSARSRREGPAGPWLPEPVDTSADPELGAERGQGLEAGILRLLEKLSPTERAAYILREAFDYTYRDIANALALEEANARQVVTRARQHLADGRKTPANSTDQRLLARLGLGPANVVVAETVACHRTAAVPVCKSDGEHARHRSHSGWSVRVDGRKSGFPCPGHGTRSRGRQRRAT